jgi:hypothetical protein
LDNAGSEMAANLRLARAKAVATYDMNRMVLNAGELSGRRSDADANGLSDSPPREPKP